MLYDNIIIHFYNLNPLGRNEAYMILRILCVCKYNSCRSPMFVALLRREVLRRAEDYSAAKDLDMEEKLKHIGIESAGTFVNADMKQIGKPASENAIACMGRLGLDITEHRSKSLASVDLKHFDLIVCVGNEEADIVTGLRPWGAVIVASAATGGIPNPWRQNAETYEECAQKIETSAKAIVARFF